MGRKQIGMNVFDAAVDRMVKLYEGGHRIVVSFSGGKDSGACLEVCRLARELSGRQEPVDVVCRDEEIMYPGTYEYIERMGKLDDINLQHIYA